MDQLALFGCPGCNGPLAQDGVSNIYCDPCLAGILHDSRTSRAEHWADVTGHEGYQASSSGQVRSRGTLLKPDATGGKNNWRDEGYLRIRLGGRNTKVAHMVLSAFIGPRPDGLMGLHWNDDPLDNRLWNLYWGSRKDNWRDAWRNGRTRWQQSDAKPSLPCLPRYVPCSIEGCNQPAMKGASGANCEEHYWEWRRAVALRARELAAALP